VKAITFGLRVDSQIPHTYAIYPCKQFLISLSSALRDEANFIPSFFCYLKDSLMKYLSILFIAMFLSSAPVLASDFQATLTAQNIEIDGNWVTADGDC